MTEEQLKAIEDEWKPVIALNASHRRTWEDARKKILALTAEVRRLWEENVQAIGASAAEGATILREERREITRLQEWQEKATRLLGLLNVDAAEDVWDMAALKIDGWAEEL